jgi:conjugal transfer/entry exclusion protein
MRFVVDLDNYDQNIESIIKVLESIQKAARDQTLEFKNIDIKKEIQNLQNFKNNLLSAISNSAEKQQKEKEACEKQQEEGEEKKIFCYRQIWQCV